MEKKTTEYGADVEIEQKTLDDYDSKKFDIGSAADDYDTKAAAESGENGSFLNPDEKLQDWDFGGLQMEKHSKSARAANRKRKKDPREESPEESTEPAAEEIPDLTLEEAIEPAEEEVLDLTLEEAPAPEEATAPAAEEVSESTPELEQEQEEKQNED